MLIIKSLLLSQFEDVTFGFSTKIGLNRNEPYNFNLSLSVTDEAEKVKENRNEFASALGLDAEKVIYQKQIHSEIINYGEDPTKSYIGDALITAEPGIGLAVSSADCNAIFVYDKKNKVIAGIHSGWKGTSKRIVYKTLRKIISEYGSNPAKIFVYMGPSIAQSNYEIGVELVPQFEQKYIKEIAGRYFLDIVRNNFDMLIENGIPKRNIQQSNLCSYSCHHLLHSYRREGVQSGRGAGIIALKEKR